MKKIIICVSFFAVFVALVIVSVIIANANNNTLIITTIPKSYCYVNGYNDRLEFSVTLYFNRTDSSLTDIKNISSVYLQNDEQMIKLECYDIVSDTKKIYIKDNEYYTYTYYFRVPITVDDEYQIWMPNAVLNIYSKTIDASIRIGSFTYSKIPYFGDSNGYLSVMNLKPVVNEVWDNKTLVAVVLGIRNSSNYNITINSLDFLNQSVYPSFDDTKHVTEDIYPSDSLSTLLGYQYTVVNQGDISDNFNYTIAPLSTLQLLIPLKYNEETIVDRLGLKMEYSYQNTSTTFYYDDFIYFQALPLTLDNLQLYTYENY